MRRAIDEEAWGEASAEGAGDAAALMDAALRCPETSWSIGEFGALGEFHHGGMPGRVAGRTLEADGGALRIASARSRPVAYETVSGRPRQWLHGVAFCLPEAEARMHRRHGIARLGLDVEALREEDRGSVIFDLGLGLRTVDFCVRTADAALIALLERSQGASLAADPALYEAVRAASPHRVLLSRLARLEIRSPIPGPHAAAPSGPHTHLLPRLLDRARSHSANLPIPAGWLPCLSMYPPHPLQDGLGREHAFAADKHARFQATLARFGLPRLLEAKNRAEDAVRRGQEAPLLGTRQERLAVRVALLQMAARQAGFEQERAPGSR